MNGRADWFRREKDGEDSGSTGSDPAFGNSSGAQVEGLGQPAPRQRSGGVSPRLRVERDSAPSQSRHLQEGIGGSNPVDLERRVLDPKDVEATMFVPHTPGEELRERLQAKEDELSRMFGWPRVKVIERAGTALENLLYSKNPWGQEVCGRTDCHVCREGSKSLGQCR